MPENPYNEYPINLGRVLALVYGIDARPYDTELQLWVKVARSLGVSVTPYDDLDAVLSRISDAGGSPPSPPSVEPGFTWEPTNLDGESMVGLSASISPALPGITTLTVNHTSNREGYFFSGAADLVTLSFPNLTSMEGDAFIVIQNLPALTTLSFPELVSTEAFGLVNINNIAATSLSFPKLEATIDFSIGPCAALVSVSFPSLVTADPLTVNQCPLLTDISLPAFLPTNGSDYSFNANALSASCVNSILARGVANPAFVSGILRLNGGTNAAPTGQGIVDKATLQGRGVTVNTN